VTRAQLPTFDLVVATVDRVEEPRRLLESLERQTHRGFRVLLVDQNEDDRLAPLVAAGIERLRAPRGLSRARNAALPRVRADVVAFPDDDCVYPGDLLERVAPRFAAEPTLDGVTGRDQNAGWPTEACLLTRDNVWNRAISFTIFLRAAVVARVGAFDERLGLPESSGEEIDYLIRAIDAGARIAYDPSLVVHHEATARPLAQLGARDGASIGYLLRKHRYPRRRVAPMLVRPAAGVLLSALRNDRARARFHASTLRGRLLGYRGVGAAPQ
jgi:glycosyltransferase involved in cell wall biosynthesis